MFQVIDNWSGLTKYLLNVIMSFDFVNKSHCLLPTKMTSKKQKHHIYIEWEAKRAGCWNSRVENNSKEKITKSKIKCKMLTHRSKITLY